jgi:flagellar basal-body rod protein FlgF
MLKELYTAAMGMIPQQTRLEVNANNMANANTIGYKRQSIFERNLIDAQQIFSGTPGQADQKDPPTGAYIDYTQGAMDKTDNPLDLAIDNPDGFFVVQDDEGKQFLTKAGHFTLSNDGAIVTMDGKKLLGEGGTIFIKDKSLFDQANYSDSKSIDIKINCNGEVFANDKQVGNITIAKVENPDTIEHISNADFIARKDTIIDILPSDEVQIRQGWLENSNVNIVNEMVAMIELQRMFEMGTKVIQTNDSTLDSSIRIGRYY